MKKVKAGSKTAATAQIVREFVQVQHDFTDTEKLELSKQHVASIQRSNTILEQIKTTTADLKAKVNTEKGLANEIMVKLANGYEMVTKEVSITFNRKTGLKTLAVYAPGTPHHGKHVRDEAMTQADFEKLPLDDAPTPPKENTKPLSKKELAKQAKEAQDAITKNQVTGEGESSTTGED